MSPRETDPAKSAQAALVAALGDAAAGDRGALKTIYDRTSAKLLSVCLRILKDRNEAEDVLQEVFISIWKRAGTFEAARSSPMTWLCTIARNRAIDRLRSRQLRMPTAPVEAALDLADDRPDGFAAAAERQQGERIHHCLSTLEGRAQEVIRTAFFDGVSYSDLATRAGVPLGTLKSWIRRGLQRLKKCLEA